METDNTNVGRAILEGVCESDAKDLILETADDVLSSAFGLELLQKIPGFQMLAAFISVNITIRERLFIHKVASFLYGLKKVSAKDRTNFKTKIDRNPKFRRKVGNALVLLLDKLDDLDKPEMLAKCFGAYLRGKIDYTTFLRLGSAIDAGFIEDLKEYAAKPSYPRRGPAPQRYPNLLRTGLVEIEVDAATNAWGEGPAGLDYTDSNIGSIFQKIMRGKI